MAKKATRTTDRTNETTASSSGNGTIDAVAILDSLNEDSLAQSIADAHKAVQEATAHLRALQTLQKVLQFRTGKITRKSPKKSVKTLVLQYLRDEGPAKPATIAAALGDAANETAIHAALVLLTNQNWVAKGENGYYCTRGKVVG